MKIAVTTCCKDKKKVAHKLKAIDMYLDTRIKKVYDIAEKSGIQMAVLSGKYGLIWSYDKIEYYDYLMQDSDIDSIKKKCIEFIKKNSITEIEFYTDTLTEDRHLAPYHTALKEACIEENIELIFNIDRRNG